METSEQLLAPTSPHRVIAQHSSSYEDDDVSEKVLEKKKERTTSTSSSSSASSKSSNPSSKASVGSKESHSHTDDNVEETEQHLLESAEQELLDEMIVREDVAEEFQAPSAPLAAMTIQEEKTSEQSKIWEV